VAFARERVEAMQQLGVPNITELNTSVDVALGDELMDDGKIKGRVVKNEWHAPMSAEKIRQAITCDEYTLLTIAGRAEHKRRREPGTGLIDPGGLGIDGDGVEEDLAVGWEPGAEVSGNVGQRGSHI